MIISTFNTLTRALFAVGMYAQKYGGHLRPYPKNLASTRTFFSFFLLWSHHYFFRTWPRRTTAKLECSFKNSTRFCSGACILAPWLLSKDSSSWHKIQQYSPWWKFGAPCIWFWSSKTFGRWGCPCHHCSGWHLWLFGTRCVFFSPSS